MTFSLGRWWEHRAALVLIMIAATVPLWFVRLPPLIDLLGHMGRYHVEAGLPGNPYLAANWNYQWRLIGNLGCDLVMAIITPLMGVERGAIILSGLILIVMMSGMIRLGRAAHGEVPATVWAAFPLAMSYPWHYGLVNYWLSIGLALHATAFVWPKSDTLQRAGWLCLFSLGLWTVHIYGWAVFSILILAKHLAERPWTRTMRSSAGLIPLALPLVAMAAARYGMHGSSAKTLDWFAWTYKASSFSWTFRDQVRALDLGTLIGVVLLIGAGLFSRRFHVNRALAGAALILFLAVILLPYQLFGSAYADGRLWPVVLLVAVLAIRPISLEGRLSLSIATISVLVFIGRLSFTTAGFLEYDAAYSRHLAAIDTVPRGSKVVVLVDFPCRQRVAWRRMRLEHLDGIGIARRDLFTNGQWDVPGAELLKPLAAAGTAFNSDPSELVRSCGNAIPAVSAKIARFPRDRFDYVWLIGYQPASLPAYPGLSPLFADEQTILYRIKHDTPAVDRRSVL